MSSQFSRLSCVCVCVSNLTTILQYFTLIPKKGFFQPNTYSLLSLKTHYKNCALKLLRCKTFPRSFCQIFSISVKIRKSNFPQLNNFAKCHRKYFVSTLSLTAFTVQYISELQLSLLSNTCG